MSPDSLPVPLLLGPTASGKSRLAMEWALSAGATIICMDSRTIYRGLDIGTAKPSREDQQRVPHALLDIAEVGTPISAARLAQKAERCIREHKARQLPCLVVGGSTLHLTALVKGLSPIPSIDPEVRARLNSELGSMGVDVLSRELKKVDAITAQSVDLRNPARVIRALEVLESTGKPLSYWHSVAPTPPAFRYSVTVLDAKAEWLAPRIAHRSSRMVTCGLLGETALHVHRGNALKAVIGYREALDVLSGRLDASLLPEQIATSTRQYARRQRRYFAKQFPDAVALDATENPGVEDISDAFAEAQRRAQP